MRKFTTMSRGLVAAMEDDSTLPTPDETVEGSGMDTPAAVVADAATEVADSTADGEAMDAQKEEAEDTMEALESIHDALRVSASNGGMDRHSAKVVSIAVEHMYARVGIAKPAMPAMESFGSSSSRVGATSLAMETVMESIKSIWKAICDAIKRGIAWITEHYNKVFGFAERLVKRADAVAAKAEALSTQKIKDTKFDSESVFKALHIGSSVTEDSVKKGVSDLAGLAKALYTEQANSANAVGEEIASALENFKAADAGKAFLPIFSKVNNPHAEYTQSLSADAAQPMDGMKGKTTPELLGGKAVISITPTVAMGAVNADTVKQYAASKTYMGDFKKQPTPKASVPTLKSNVIGDLAGSVKTLAEAVISYKTNLKKASEIKARVVKAAENIGKEAVAAEAGAEKTNLQFAQKFASSISTKLDQPFVEFSSYVLNTGKAVLDYAEQSMKHYEAK
jgi:hypothetical protein